LSIVALITAITLVATSYIIKYDDLLYSKFSKILSVLEFRKKKIYELAHKVENHFDAVLFGCDRIGYSIIQTFAKLKYKFLVVDFNPEIIQELASKGISCLYGDFEDFEIIGKIDMKKPRIFISTIPDFRGNVRLIRNVRRMNKNAAIFVTATTINEALELYEKGADYVIMPHFLGGEHTSYILENLKRENISQRREKHIEELKKRKLLKQEHPAR